LKWVDFDANAGTIRVERAVCPITGKLKDTKTPKSHRTLPLATSTIAALASLSGDPDSPLIPNSWAGTNGSRISRNGCSGH